MSQRHSPGARWMAAPIVVGSIGLLLGFGLGYLFGTKDPSHPALADAPKTNFSLPATAAPTSAAPPVRPAQDEAPYTSDENAQIWRELDGTRSNFDQTLSLMQRMATMDASALLALLDDADSLGFHDHQSAGAMLLGRLAEIDADAALERALSGPPQYRTTWLHAVFHSLSRIDSQTALVIAESLSQADRRTAARAIVLSIQDREPDIRTAVIDGLRVNNIFPVNPRSNPAGAWEAALAPGGVRGRQQLYGIARTWAQQDPIAALQAVADSSSLTNRDAYRQYILSTWASTDPTAAVDWMLANPDSLGDASQLTSFVESLSQSNPEAAEQLLASLTGSQRLTAERSLKIASARSDPAGAVRWLLLEESESERLSTAQAMLHRFDGGTETAEQFISGLPESMHDSLRSLWANSLANQNLEAAIDYVQQIDDPHIRANASQQVVMLTTNEDPQRAIALIEDLPPPQRPKLYSSLTLMWSQRDPAAAVSFTRGLSGRAFETAAVGVIDSQQADPSDAVALMDRIQDAGLRNRAAMSIYRMTLAKDPKAAEDFRQKEGLPDIRGLYGY